MYPSGAMKALRVTLTWTGSNDPTGAILGSMGQTLTNLTASGGNESSSCSASLSR
jgi:hypothetical protein